MCSDPPDSGNLFTSDVPDVTPSTERRYRAEKLDDIAWRVVDQLTGLTAASNGKDIVQLSEEDARDLAAELNHCDENGLPSPLL